MTGKLRKLLLLLLKLVMKAVIICSNAWPCRIPHAYTVPNDDTTLRRWNVRKCVNNWRHSSGQIYLHVIFLKYKVFFSLRGVHCSKLSMNYNRASTRKSEKACCYYWEEYCRFRSIKRESFSEHCTRLFLHPPFSYCFLRLQGYARLRVCWKRFTEVMR